MSYRWLDHTSELELHIDAPTERAVFELAVAALGELLEGDGAAESLTAADGGRTADRAHIAREITVVSGHRGRPRRLVKGVTYNELTFAPVGARFVATVVLDV